MFFRIQTECEHLWGGFSYPARTLETPNKIETVFGEFNTQRPLNQTVLNFIFINSQSKKYIYSSNYRNYKNFRFWNSTSFHRKIHVVFSGFVIAITTPYPVGIYQLQINDRNNGSIYDNNTRTRSNEVVLVSFLLALISHLVLMFSLLTLNEYTGFHKSVQLVLAKKKNHFFFLFDFLFYFFIFWFTSKNFLVKWKGNLYKFWKIFQSFGQ